MTASDPAVLQAFDALAERLARPEAWTQRYHARDERGFVVRYDDPTACSWCLDGALLSLSYMPAWLSVSDALESIEPRYIRWNDSPGRTHAEVLALIAAARAALTLAGAQPGRAGAALGEQP